MARKTATVTIETEGRDKGKVFIITEADPQTTEDFCARLIMAALNAGAEIPEGIAGMGLAGVVMMGANAFSLIPYEKLKPLMVEMMTCVQYQTSPGVVRIPNMDGDIEEVGTLLTLRKAVRDVHTDFFTVAKRLTSDTSPQPAAQTSSHTPT